MSPAAKKGATRKRAATKKAPARKKKAAAKRAPARRKSTAAQDDCPEEHRSQEHRSQDHGSQEHRQEGDQEEGNRSQEGRDEADSCSQEHGQEGDAQARREESPQALTSLGAPVIVRVRPAQRRSRTRRRDTTRSNNSRGCTPGTTNESPNSQAGVAAIPSSRAASIDAATASLPSPAASAALTSLDGAPLSSTSVVSTSGSPMSTPVTKCASNSASSSAGNDAGHRRRTTSAVSSARRLFGTWVGARNGMPTASHSRPIAPYTVGEAAVRLTRRDPAEATPDAARMAAASPRRRAFAEPRSGPVRGSTTGRCSRTRP